MIAGVGFRDPGILAGSCPVEVAGINDNAAQCCAVAADELCSRVNYDVCTVLDRSDEVRCTECVVDNERDACLVSDLSKCFDIRDVR